MTTAATSLLGLALPVTGELAGTWGTTVNDSITSLLDTAVAGTTTLSTDADVTLTTTTLAANQARQAILLCSGARTALRTITAPAQSKIYTIINATTGGFSVKLVGVGPTTGLTIPNGASAVVAWNGSDFIEVGSATVGNLTVNGNLSVTGTTSLTGVATLTANPVLSAGTANGVAYLNGSKVVTTGSALTFDGTKLKSQYIYVQDFGATNDFVFGFNTNAGTQVGYLGVTSSANNLTMTSSNSLIFAASSSEQMRLTSTGLGIGTSSPSEKLSVNGAITAVSTAYNSNGIILGTAVGSYDWRIADSGASTYALTFGSVSGGTTTERMRLDSSGNLGLGVTPSAWGSGGRIQASGFGSKVDGIDFFNNAYNNGGWKYASNGYAQIYAQDAGRHIFYTAASGTAGNAITFTQAMTLDSSGNLLVGQTSASGRLHVTGAGNTSASNAVYVQSTDSILFVVRNDGRINTGATTLSPYNNTTASAANMFVDSAGTLFRSTSSLKYKTNVQNAAHGLAELLALRPVTYEGNSKSDEGKTFGGLIAEEVHAAGLTEFVQYAEDGSPDALAYGNMVSLCIKAIQEQQAIIEQLKADVAALKGN